MNSPLSVERITTLRQLNSHPLIIEVAAQTGSTNADLLHRIDTLASPVLLAAEMQTAGRGRAGRAWHATPGAALTFSLAWKFRTHLSALTGLPLAVGVVIAETLAKFNVDVGLKWPNDVLKDGNKLAGVLIETASVKIPAGNAVWAVIGIGINVAMASELVAQIGRPVADLSGFALDRNALLAALADGLSEALPHFEQSGFSAFAKRWNHWHAHADQQVVILDHGNVICEGTARGVDEAGRLLLDTAAGITPITAGDVSLRSMER